MRLDEAREAAHRRDAVDLAHLELEILDSVHDVAVDAGRIVLVFRLRLGDHLQQVDADREVAA
jgi:hypothetical protein